MLVRRSAACARIARDTLRRDAHVICAAFAVMLACSISAHAVPNTQASGFSPPGIAADAEFGFAVATDTTSAVIGAPGGNGAAYVYVNGGGSWILQQPLTPLITVAGEELGTAVAVDNATAVVGAPHAGAGRVVVFVRQSGVWSQQAVLVAAGGSSGDGFGASVAVAGDSVLVGAPLSLSERGRVHVFTRSGTVWTERLPLVATDGVAGDRLGSSVDLAGALAVAGAPLRNGARGAVYVWNGAPDAFIAQPTLTAAAALVGTAFGSAVAMTGIADALVVGAPGDSSNRGGIYAHARAGLGWGTGLRFDVGGAIGDQLGWSVAVDSARAAVGAPFAVIDAVAGGSVRSYTRSGPNWLSNGPYAAPGLAPNDLFGWSVAGLSDGALAGAPDRTPSLAAPRGGTTYRLTELEILFDDGFE